MTLEQTMSELASKGSDATKRVLARHGAKEPFFGVKIGDLKVIHKKIKGDQALALRLYATGNGDAQYLAGMVADGRKMTPSQLHDWADSASWNMISGTTVPWVASEHPAALEVALRWLDSPKPQVAVSGWNTLGALAATVPDDRLPVKQFATLLDRVARALESSSDDVRSAMNAFIIACGTYVAPLGDHAIATARKLGRVEVDGGDTACKVPDAESYIRKCRRDGAVAPKRKTMRC